MKYKEIFTFRFGAIAAFAAAISGGVYTLSEFAAFLGDALYVLLAAVLTELTALSVLCVYLYRARRDSAAALLLVAQLALSLPATAMYIYALSAGGGFSPAWVRVHEWLYNISALFAILFGIALLRPGTNAPALLRASGVLCAAAGIAFSLVQFIAAIPFSIAPEYVWIAGNLLSSAALACWGCILWRAGGAMFAPPPR